MLRSRHAVGYAERNGNKKISDNSLECNQYFKYQSLQHLLLMSH